MRRRPSSCRRRRGITTARAPRPARPSASDLARDRKRVREQRGEQDSAGPGNTEPLAEATRRDSEREARGDERVTTNRAPRSFERLYGQNRRRPSTRTRWLWSDEGDSAGERRAAANATTPDLEMRPGALHFLNVPLNEHTRCVDHRTAVKRFAFSACPAAPRNGSRPAPATGSAGAGPPVRPTARSS